MSSFPPSGKKFIWCIHAITNDPCCEQCFVLEASIVGDGNATEISVTLLDGAMYIEKWTSQERCRLIFWPTFSRNLGNGSLFIYFIIHYQGYACPHCLICCVFYPVTLSAAKIAIALPINENSRICSTGGMILTGETKILQGQPKWVSLFPQ